MAKGRLPQVLTDDQLAALLRQVNVRTKTGLRNKAMLKVMAYGGLRVSEVVALSTKDVRRDGGRIVLEIRDGKGGKDRTVPLPDHAAETLEAWLAKREELGIGNGHVFCTVSTGTSVHPVATSAGLAAGEVTETALTPGGPIAARYAQTLVPRLGERADLEQRVTPHVLRHTAATRLLRETGNLRVVQDFLGHASVSTTQVYTHVLADEVAAGVDAVADVEADDDGADEADTLAAQVLAALPAEVREALARQLAGGDG